MTERDAEHLLRASEVSIRPSSDGDVGVFNHEQDAGDDGRPGSYEWSGELDGEGTSDPDTSPSSPLAPREPEVRHPVDTTGHHHHGATRNQPTSASEIDEF